MYATCLFCTHPLGSNDVLEIFPVGRRIAFDSTRGRLWVVCKRCERWNLSPIEERWETVEECERLFRDTRTRVSTEQIGLARLAEGLELVRIGRPQRPEFAAWRYGDQFGRRRRKALLYAAGGIAVFGGIIVGGAATGVFSAGLLSQSGNFVNIWVNGRTRLKLRTDDGRVIRLKNMELQRTRVLPGDEPGSINVSVGKGRKQQTFAGEEAERMVSLIVPKLNASGGNSKHVQTAVREIEATGGPDAFFQDAIRRRPRPRNAFRSGKDNTGMIGQLPVHTRLAIEMALHEERERRALEGELKLLEVAWKAAEEIAAISDDLLLPADARAFLDSQKEVPDVQQARDLSRG